MLYKNSMQKTDWESCWGSGKHVKVQPTFLDVLWPIARDIHRIQVDNKNNVKKVLSNKFYKYVQSDKIYIVVHECLFSYLNGSLTNKFENPCVHGQYARCLLKSPLV